MNAITALCRTISVALIRIVTSQTINVDGDLGDGVGNILSSSDYGANELGAYENGLQCEVKVSDWYERVLG